MKKVMSILFGHGEITDLIDDKKGWRHDGLFDETLIALILLCIAQLHEQIGSGGKSYFVAVLYCFVGQCNRKMGFTDT